MSRYITTRAISLLYFFPNNITSFMCLCRVPLVSCYCAIAVSTFKFPLYRLTCSPASPLVASKDLAPFSVPWQNTGIASGIFIQMEMQRGQTSWSANRIEITVRDCRGTRNDRPLVRRCSLYTFLGTGNITSASLRQELGTKREFETDSAILFSNDTGFRPVSVSTIS